MKSTARLLAWLVLLLAASAAAAPRPKAARPAVRRVAAPAPSFIPEVDLRAKPKERARYGVFLGQSRIGSMVTRTYNVRFEGAPAIRLDADTDIQLTTLGSAVSQKLDLQYLLDASGRPMRTRFQVSSSGRSTTISATYQPEQVVCTVDVSGQSRQQIVPIPRGAVLVGDPQHSARPGEMLQVGQKMVFHFFEPLTLTIQKVETEVVREEARTVAGREVAGFLVKSTNSIAGASQSWVDAQGRLLEENSAVGLRLLREDLEAPGAYEPPQDFAVATSLRTEVKLPDARNTGFLQLKISGIPDDRLVLSDTRQRVMSREAAGDRTSALYVLQTRELPAAGARCAPASATGEGLGDAAYLAIGDLAIRRQAREIAGSDTDRAVLARRLRAWVKAHIQKQNNIGTPRTAAEIMRSRDGVCRDYATLFTALARALGVPTRVCSGIVYFQDGFFYHAWVECQLQQGPDAWYALDPTLDSDFVDATHVKFAQGDPTAMFAAVRLVGQIQAEILEYR